MAEVGLVRLPSELIFLAMEHLDGANIIIFNILLYTVLISHLIAWTLESLMLYRALHNYSYFGYQNVPSKNLALAPAILAVAVPIYGIAIVGFGVWSQRYFDIMIGQYFFLLGILLVYIATVHNYVQHRAYQASLSDKRAGDWRYAKTGNLILIVVLLGTVFSAMWKSNMDNSTTYILSMPILLIIDLIKSHIARSICNSNIKWEKFISGDVTNTDIESETPTPRTAYYNAVVWIVSIILVSMVVIRYHFF